MANNTQHTDVSENPSAIKSAFWLVIILVGLYIGALNFITAMSSNKEEGKEATTEMKSTSDPSANEKTENKPEAPAATAAAPQKQDSLVNKDEKKEEPKKAKKKHRRDYY